MDILMRACSAVDFGQSRGIPARRSWIYSEDWIRYGLHMAAACLWISWVNEIQFCVWSSFPFRFPFLSTFSIRRLLLIDASACYFH